jgi:hypothetical protein
VHEQRSVDTQDVGGLDLVLRHRDNAAIREHCQVDPVGMDQDGFRVETAAGGFQVQTVSQGYGLHTVAVRLEKFLQGGRAGQVGPG